MISDQSLHAGLFCVVVVFHQLHCCFAMKLTDSSKTMMGDGAAGIQMQTTALIAKETDNDHPSLRKNAEKTSGSMINRILPVLIVPFLISSAIIPLMLGSIKILLVKGFFTGTIAVVLMLLSFFRRRTEGGGVYDHYAPDIVPEHYGYQGIDEPGVYVHKRRKRRFAKSLPINA